MGTSSGAKRGKRKALRTVGLLLVLAFMAYVAYQFTGKKTEAAGCTVKAEDDSLDLSRSQAANASTIAAVATARRLPERAVTIALATALQESRLDNLDHGDRDSLGLFQQRPSQGWGTEKQILDPVYSANSFYDALVKIDGYSKLPLTVAAQRVQRSGYPEAYAKHEADATLLAAALVGRHAGALSCTTGEDRADSAGGAPGDPEAVAAELKREFGAQVRPRTAGGAAAGVTVAAASAKGWQLAQWSVAHAHDLKLSQVSFDGMRWRAERSGAGWQKAADGDGGGAGRVRITVAQ
jgi:hypothetical protein